MSKKVYVLNLSTGEERFYLGLTPEQAVIAAYEQSQKHNYSTWTYPSPEKHPHFRKGEKTVACGDWTAALVQPSRNRKVSRRRNAAPGM
jgi:hypothetical protein